MKILKKKKKIITKITIYLTLSFIFLLKVLNEVIKILSDSFKI